MENQEYIVAELNYLIDEVEKTSHNTHNKE